ITVTVDTVAILVALWAALALKFDRLDPALAHTLTYFVLAVASAMSIFSVSGLYRTVIRFAGPKAMTSIIAGVSFSVVVLAVFDRWALGQQIPLTAFGTYWALALLSVGGSRFIARNFFLHSGANGRQVARLAIYGAGDAGVRVCSALLGG